MLDIYELTTLLGIDGKYFYRRPDSSNKRIEVQIDNFISYLNKNCIDINTINLLIQLVLYFYNVGSIKLLKTKELYATFNNSILNIKVEKNSFKYELIFKENDKNVKISGNLYSGKDFNVVGQNIVKKEGAVESITEETISYNLKNEFIESYILTLQKDYSENKTDLINDHYVKKISETIQLVKDSTFIGYDTVEEKYFIIAGINSNNVLRSGLKKEITSEQYFAILNNEINPQDLAKNSIYKKQLKR